MSETIEFTGSPYGNSVMREMYPDLDLRGAGLDAIVPERHPVAGGEITCAGVVIRLDNGFEVEQPWALFSHRRFVYGGLGIYQDSRSVFPEFLFLRRHFATEEAWSRFLSIAEASVRPWSFWHENSVALWLALILGLMILAAVVR
jgi:hypothetical protein